MAHFSCDSTQIKYTPNGVQTLWTFPFEYIEETDIWVGFWNDDTREWDRVTHWPDQTVAPPDQTCIYWTLENATTIKFLEAVNENRDWRPRGSRFGPHSWTAIGGSSLEIWVSNLDPPILVQCDSNFKVKGN